MAFPPLPDPVPKYLPPGFEPLHEHALEANSVPIATGPTTPVDGPMTSKMRMYVFGPASFEAMKHGPAIHVIVSYASALPPEWFEGLQGEPVDISGSSGFYRGGSDRISLIVLRGTWIIEVATSGVGKTETLAVARSLDL